MKYLMLTSLVAGLFALSLQADEPLLPSPKKNDWYTKAVKKYTVTVDPVEAKPGQTVTLKISFELADGYTTYPTVQPDKNAETMVNKITYPEAGAVIFVGETLDPVKFKKKSELDVGIKELRYYEGKITYERKFVVNPTQKPGEIVIEIASFKLMVCDAKNCFPAKNLKPQAKLKVLAGPAVAVDKEFADEVQKALNGM